MSRFDALLKTKKVLIADGAWGTELARQGLPAGVPPERWNIDQPTAVRAVAEAYVRAGAEIILTNSFGASRFKLAKAGLDGQVAEINRAAAALSRAAAGDAAMVFASIGPTGEFLQPLGSVSPDDLSACFAEQAAALADGGADGVVVETMSDLAEATTALRAAKDRLDGPVAVTLTFQKGSRGYATMMGVTPEQAAKALDAAGADLIGANCGTGVEDAIAIVEKFRQATDKPIWIKPNAGLPELVDGQTVYRLSPRQLADRLAELASAGARVVGGCCGTTPEHIRALAAARDRLG